MRNLKAVVLVVAALAQAHERMGSASLRATHHKAMRQPDGTFDKFDADGDGSISWGEFQAAKGAGQRFSEVSSSADQADAEDEGPEDDPSAEQPNSELVDQLREATDSQPQEPQDASHLSVDESAELEEVDEPEASNESRERDDTSIEDSNELMEEEKPNTHLGDELRTVMPNRPLQNQEALEPYQGNLPPEEETEEDEEEEQEASMERDDADVDEIDVPELEEEEQEDVVDASGKEPVEKAVEVDDWLPASENGAATEDVEEQATEQARWASEEDGAEAVVRDERQQEQEEQQLAERQQQQQQQQQEDANQALSGCKWCAQSDPNCDQLWCSNNCAKQCGAAKAAAMLGPSAGVAETQPQGSDDPEQQLSGCAWCSAHDTACQQPWCSKNCPQQCATSQGHQTGPANHVEAVPQLSGCQWCLANDAKCATKWCANNCATQCSAPKVPGPTTAVAPGNIHAQAAGLSPEAQTTAVAPASPPTAVAPATAAAPESIQAQAPMWPGPTTAVAPPSPQAQASNAAAASTPEQANNAAVAGTMPWMSMHGSLPPMSFLEGPSLARELRVLPPTPRATD